MNIKEQKKRSRLLSLVLRHDPSSLNLTLDEKGWAKVNRLLLELEKKGLATTKAELIEIVRINDKKRFKLSEDGLLIRANQGHSIDVELDLTLRTPPPTLYHGTAEKFTNSILKKGLEKRTRNHVHLSSDIHTARKVGSRHGAPVIFEIATESMIANGHQFYRSENNVWLTEFVPSKYLSFRKTDHIKNGIVAIQSDITTLAVDVIVNAANSSLLGGGGVDGAIHRAAGKDLVHECRLLGGCKTGEAKITGGYNLAATHIIHTVGPVWRGGAFNEPTYLRQCYLNSFELSRAHNLKSIALPCISTGVYNYPAKEAAHIAVSVARDFANLLEITFCCYDTESLQHYRNLLK